MKRYIAIIVLSVLFSTTVNSQYAVVSSGNTISNNSGEISFSIGQVAVLEAKSNAYSFYAGVQQPYFFISTIDDNTFIDKDNIFSYYPNPVENVVNIVCKYADKEREYKLFMFSMSGTLIGSYTITEQTISIDMSGLPSGVYYFRLMGNGVNEYFNIIKK